MTVCPLGYDSNGTRTCSTGSADTVSYTFDQITKTWTSGTVTFEAGLDADDEVEDFIPYTYKLRGAYFSGTSLLSLTTNMYLHAKLSIDLWFLPLGASGSLISKSYSNWENSTTSAFLDIRLAAGVSIEFSIQATITTIENCVVQDIWNHLGLLVDFDKGNDKTIVTPIIQGVVGNSVEIADTIILEDVDSTGAIGARFDGNSGNKTLNNLFTGFIRTINITPLLLSSTTIVNKV